MHAIIVAALTDAWAGCFLAQFWPGSHRRMYHAFQFESNAGAAPSYERLFRSAVDEIEPVEICGPAGTVIFWHGRMLHSPGIHRGSVIRFAVPADFQQAGTPTVTPSEGAGHMAFPENTPEEVIVEHGLEWHKDTVTFLDDRAPHADMWDGWRI